MKRYNITYELLRNYIVVFIITSLLTLLVFAGIASINSLNSAESIYQKLSAKSLMKDDYKTIDTKALEEFNGSLQVIDSNYNLVYSVGKLHFTKESLSPQEFTDFLTSSSSSEDIITVEYNEKENFWLVVSMPIKLKVNISVLIYMQKLQQLVLLSHWLN